MHRKMLLMLALSGCAATTVTPVYQHSGPALPRPRIVLVHRFAISADEVTEDQGFVAQAAASLQSTPMDERRRQTATEAADRLADDLVTGIQQLGLPAERAHDSTPADALVIGGAFIDVNQGNTVQRLVIGLGAGQSSIDTKIRATYRTEGAYHLLAKFEAHADSGEMPGAAITMGAGAAASGGVTAGMAAANVALSGAKAYRSALDPMIDRMADKVVVSLSHFFASQGWIGPDQIKAASWSDL